MRYHTRAAITFTLGAITAATISKRKAEAKRLAEEKRIADQKNLSFDLMAISIAGQKVHEMIREGKIRELDQLKNALHSEVKFQQIALREN
jgi:hypothetical protein